jgi:hypothetical protein
MVASMNNKAFNEQFGTKGVSDKIWFVLSDNKWFVPGHDGLVVSRIHGKTAREAEVNFMCLHRSHRCMGAFESFEAAQKAVPYSPLVLQ